MQTNTSNQSTTNAATSNHESSATDPATLAATSPEVSGHEVQGTYYTCTCGMTCYVPKDFHFFVCPGCGRSAYF